MKAILIKAYGGLQNCEYGELPEPVAGKGEVLVRVRFCSINPLDVKISSGSLSPVSGLRFPRAMGSDFSGTVAGLGAGVSAFKLGDEVYGHANIMFGRQGALAESVSVAQKNLRLRPDHVSAETAACLPVAGTTALNGLKQCADIQGRRVIVAGASGGVGHLVVQLAKARGALVTGTASARNEQFVRGLGADDFADYRTKSPAELEAGAVFFDAFGSTPYSEAVRALLPGGTFVTTLPSPRLILRRLFFARIRFANVQAAPAVYQELEDTSKAGKLRVHIAETISLADGVRALQRVEEGGSVGKIVVRVSQ